MIIDASVAVKWLVFEEESDRALDLIGRSDLRAPSLIQSEVANAIWRKHRRGELKDDPDLSSLPMRLGGIVAIVDESPVMGRALELALLLDHPVYDVVYLALAEAAEDVLLTADHRFLRRLAGTDHHRRVETLGS